MKRFTAFLLTLVMLFSCVSVSNVEAKSINVIVNGKHIYFTSEPFMQNNSILVPMRDILEVFDAKIIWKDSTQEIIVAVDSVQIQMQINNPELKIITENKTSTLSLNTAPQLINGTTFIPVRVISQISTANINWDSRTQTVRIETDGTPLYEAGNLNVLLEQKIITQKELDGETSITNSEALKTINKIVSGRDFSSEDTKDISGWYRNDALEPLVSLDDSYKGLFLDLLYGDRPVLTTTDVLNIQLEKALTNYEALVYVTRMVGNTYGCTDTPTELTFTEKSQTFQSAYNKGIIDNIDMQKADQPIERKDFYTLLHKAIFVEMSVGGYAPSTDRYIDIIVRRNKINATPKEEISMNEHEISIRATIHNDLSVSWTLPNEHQHLNGNEYTTSLSLITDEDTRSSYSSTSIKTSIDTKSMVRMMVRTYPKKPKYIRVSYYDYQTHEEYHFDIDVSNISLVIKGDELFPGVYTRYNHEWVPRTITLANNQIFKANAYYLLKSYQRDYRKSEYNSVSYDLFTVSENSKKFENLSHSSLGWGGVFLEDVHIQEITLSGNSASGFTLYMTPESTNSFKVVEASS